MSRRDDQLDRFEVVVIACALLLLLLALAGQAAGAR
jgi:hypothetical protein